MSNDNKDPSVTKARLQVWSEGQELLTKLRSAQGAEAERAIESASVAALWAAETFAMDAKERGGKEMPAQERSLGLGAWLIERDSAQALRALMDRAEWAGARADPRGQRELSAAALDLSALKKAEKCCQWLLRGNGAEMALRMARRCVETPKSKIKKGSPKEEKRMESEWNQGFEAALLEMMDIPAWEERHRKAMGELIENALLSEKDRLRGLKQMAPSVARVIDRLERRIREESEPLEREKDERMRAQWLGMLACEGGSLGRNACERLSQSASIKWARDQSVSRIIACQSDEPALTMSAAINWTGAKAIIPEQISLGWALAALAGEAMPAEAAMRAWASEARSAETRKKLKERQSMTPAWQPLKIKEEHPWAVIWDLWTHTTRANRALPLAPRERARKTFEKQVEAWRALGANPEWIDPIERQGKAALDALDAGPADPLGWEGKPRPSIKEAEKQASSRRLSPLGWKLIKQGRGSDADWIECAKAQALIGWSLKDTLEELRVLGIRKLDPKLVAAMEAEELKWELSDAIPTEEKPSRAGLRL